MSIASAKSALMNEIYLTREFNYLRQSKNALSQNKEYLSEVKYFQQKQQQFQERLLKNEICQDDIKEMDSEFARLMAVPPIANYLRACKMMNDFVENLVKEINSSIDGTLI